ncbi:MAG TPA: hypothetical protein VF974_07550 [Patescibacteria group bacterium]
MKHYHYEFNAFNYKSPYIEGQIAPQLLATGKEYHMGEGTVVVVIASTEEEALGKAKSIIKRNYYRLMKAFECEVPESQIDPQEIQVLQLEMQKKMLDFIKGKHGY